MTEREFDRKAEEAAQMLEQKIEGTAYRFERAVEQKWERRPFRFLIRSISLAAEAGLLAGGVFLHHAGHKGFAAALFWTGAIGLICDLLRLLFLRRDT